jgi:hypothetical protein
MPPIWNPNEAKEYEYGQVEQHSEGMISFTYRPPTTEDLASLKDTQTYRGLMKERGDAAPDQHPSQDKSIARP